MLEKTNILYKELREENLNSFNKKLNNPFERFINLILKLLSR